MSRQSNHSRPNHLHSIKHVILPLLYVLIPFIAIVFVHLPDHMMVVTTILLALPILISGSYNATKKREIFLLVIKPATTLYKILNFCRGSIIFSSIIALWTSISLLYVMYYVSAFRTAMLASFIISFLLFLFLNSPIKGINFIDNFFDKHFNEVARIYYRLRTSTILASAISVFIFYVFVSVEFTLSLFPSFYAAVDQQPRYIGDRPTLKAISDFLAYANAISEYGASLIRRAYDGDAVRLIVLCLMSFPTTYGITLGLSAFFVPLKEYRTTSAQRRVIEARSGGTDPTTYDTHDDKDDNASIRKTHNIQYYIKVLGSVCRPAVLLVLCAAGIVSLFLIFTAPFVGRLYDANYTVQTRERSQYLEKELRDETDRMQSEIRQTKAEYDQKLRDETNRMQSEIRQTRAEYDQKLRDETNRMQSEIQLVKSRYEQELLRVRTEHSDALQLIRDEHRRELERIIARHKTERDEWRSTAVEKATDVIDYQRRDALCSAFATMNVSGSMFAFWYASQSEQTRTEFGLGASNTVHDQLNKVMFSPDPFWYYENMMEVRSDLSIEVGNRASIGTVESRGDDSAALLSAEKSAAIDSIVNRLKEHHYRNEIRHANTTQHDGRKPKWLTRLAIKRICKEFGKENDRCVSDIQEFVATTGSITQFEELWAGTRVLVMEEIGELEKSVRSREAIPDDCSDMTRPPY